MSAIVICYVILLFPFIDILLLFIGSCVSHRCEFWHIVHQMQRLITNITPIKIILGAPTASPLYYNLPTITSAMNEHYEARLSITSHFQLITDCNEENVSTLQCQLKCRQKYIRDTCRSCAPSTLSAGLLGIETLQSEHATACTIKRYTECYNTGS